MASTTVAQPAPAHTVREETRERVLRGLVLHADLADEVEHTGHGVYSVPGCKGGSYTVDLAPFGGVESCTCPDHHRHPEYSCKHIVAATIYRAKSRGASRRVVRPKASPEAVEASLARMGA